MELPILQQSGNEPGVWLLGMKQESGNRAKRWLLRLGGGAVVLCLATCGFCYWINITPQVKIPTPVMPHPNGYDYFLRAAAAYVKDSKGVDEITDHSFTSGKTKFYPLAAREAWLKQNTRALQLLRKGLKYPALHSPVRSGNDSSKYSQFRDLARALAVESHVRAARGNWSGAADSALDALEFGDAIQRGGPMIAGLVGTTVQAISLRELYQVSPHLNAQAASQVAKRMEHLYAGRFPYFKTMQEEKWTQQAKMLQMMNEKHWRLKQIDMLISPPPFVALVISLVTLTPYSPPSRLEIAEGFLKNSKLLFISKRALLNNYTKGIDAYIANGRLPYNKMQSVSASGDPYTEMILPVYEDTRWSWACVDACSMLDMTTLALRAFRLEKGHYPASLKELVPGYLKTIPTDPFTDTSLHYQLQGKKYLLWSIGPDGVDNEGKPIINKDRNSAERYRLIEPDSKGDVVGGVNVP